MTPVIHLVGPDVQIGPHLRQRCSWCGTVLIDEDLRQVAVMDTGDGDRKFPTWEPGALLARDGGLSWIVEPEQHPDGDGSWQIPETSCMALDPSLTGPPAR